MSDFAAAHEELRAVTRALLAAGAGWDELAAAGFGGLDVAESAGGSGATFAEVAIVAEEVGRAAARVPFLGTAILGAAAWPNAGDTPTAVALDGFTLDAAGRLTGRDDFVVDAGQADVVLVVVDGMVVRADVAVEPQPLVDETRDVARVSAGGVPVEVLGEVDVAALRDRAALAVALDAVGVAGAMLDATVAYAKERVQFGQPIGAFQAVKHQCADMLVELTISRQLVAAAVEAPGDRRAVSMAKSHATETAVAVCGTAMQLHGGIGYTWESGVHAYLKRALLDRALFGSPHEHRRQLVTM